MIERFHYTELIRPFFNKQIIKVLTGQRRVGKSYILKMLISIIEREFPDGNIIYIDKEKYNFNFLKTDSDLMNYIETEKKSCMNYLFIDEIQDIEGFEHVLRSLHSEPNFDIYCTGSNAKLFSSELATFLSGRQISFHIGSLSFIEFCKFHNYNLDNKSLLKYMQFGGLPYLIHLPDNEQIRYEYLTNIQSTILYRDVISRNNVRDTRFFSDLLNFLADNTGSIFSALKISKYLKNQKINKNVPLILDYISFIENAFLINKVKRLDLTGKSHFEVGEKYYFEDIGLRNSIVGFRTADFGKIMENIVYLHLKHLGYSVSVGVTGSAEIDFAAEKNNEKIYVQVCYLLSNEETIEREFGNLLKIQDNYPKFVVSFDEFSAQNTYKGIAHNTLLEFLKIENF